MKAVNYLYIGAMVILLLDACKPSIVEDENNSISTIKDTSILKAARYLIEKGGTNPDRVLKLFLSNEPMKKSFVMYDSYCVGKQDSLNNNIIAECMGLPIVIHTGLEKFQLEQYTKSSKKNYKLASCYPATKMFEPFSIKYELDLLTNKDTIIELDTNMFLFDLPKKSSFKVLN